MCSVTLYITVQALNLCDHGYFSFLSCCLLFCPSHCLLETPEQEQSEQAALHMAQGGSQGVGKYPKEIWSQGGTLRYQWYPRVSEAMVCVQQWGKSPRAAERLLCSAWKPELCHRWASLSCSAVGKLSAFQDTGSPPTCARILMMMKLTAMKNLIQLLSSYFVPISIIIIFYFKERVTLNLTNFHRLNKQGDHVESSVSGDALSCE